MTRHEITQVVNGLSTFLAVLHDADPADKAEIPRRGSSTDVPTGGTKVIAEAKPPVIMYEGSCPRPNTPAHHTVIAMREFHV